MTNIEQIQNRILEKMQEILSNEEIQKLENVMAIEFHGIEVQQECTQLVTSESHWEKILRTFIASKRIENCSIGTLERYKDCVTRLVTTLNKRLQDITTNDIRYYLAMYQEQRKISMSYMDTIRRYLSSFFAWISDEGYISRNPMRRLKRVIRYRQEKCLDLWVIPVMEKKELQDSFRYICILGFMPLKMGKRSA